jgi:hypothetical protein
MAASTTYSVTMYQRVQDLLNFLNTGSLSNPGGPITQSFIVTTEYDPGNGTWYVILAPGY